MGLFIQYHILGLFALVHLTPNVPFVVCFICVLFEHTALLDGKQVHFTCPLPLTSLSILSTNVSTGLILFPFAVSLSRARCLCCTSCLGISPFHVFLERHLRSVRAWL